MKLYALGALLFALFVVATPIGSWAIEPITDALLDKAEDNAKDVIARAEEAGNAIAKAFGEQALMAIKALREAVHASIGEASDAVIDAQRQIFDNISVVLEKANESEKVVLTDVTTLTAQISDQLKNIPFTNHAPEIMMYQPRVLISQGTDIIPIHIIGPKLSASSPIVSFEGKTIQHDAARDVELIAKMDRSKLIFDDKKPQLKDIQIDFDQAESSWWNPASWFASAPVKRNMTLLLLPKTLGTYTISTKVNSTTTATKDFGKTVGGHGKDNKMDFTIKPDPLDIEDGWRIDVDKIKSDGLKFKDRGGHDASCSGLVAGTLTRDSFVFRIQHGHKTDAFGHKSDGDKTCSMTVPLIKVTPIVVDGKTISGEIGWSSDVKAELPADLSSYVLTLSLFDSKTFILEPDSKAPFGVVEIERGNDYVKFRPKPPADF